MASVGGTESTGIAGSIIATGFSGVVPIASGGTGQTSAIAAFNALSPMTAYGDVIYGGTSAPGQGTALAGNITTTKKFLSGVGTGSTAAAPAWAALGSTDIPVLMPLSGSLATMNATTGVSGQLFFNTTYSVTYQWVTDRWSFLGQIDPRYGFSLFDEFMGTDRIGQLDWNTNAGTVNLATSATTTQTGVLALSQGTSGSVANLRLNLAGVLLGAPNDIYMEALVNVPTLATVGEDFVAGLGMNDNAAFDVNGSCTDGVWFGVNRAKNGANFILSSSANSATTAVLSGFTLTAGQFYRVNLNVFGGVTAVLYANGASIAALGTNVPTGSGRNTGVQIKLDKTAGTFANQFQVDYFSMQTFFNGQRVP